MRDRTMFKLVLMLLLFRGGLETVPAQDKAGKAAADRKQTPKVTASIAEVQDRTGKTVEHAPKSPEFGDKHEFLEGATHSSVHVRLDQIDKQDCKFGICLTAPIEVIVPRYWWRPRRQGELVSVSVWYREANSWIELRPVLVFETLSIAMPPQIPHKQDTLDLFDDLVDEQALLVKVRGLESGTFYGFQRNSFQASPIPNANAKCEPKLPELVIHPKKVPSFDDVLDAVKATKQEWDAAATTLPIESMKKNDRGIPLKKARAIVSRFDGTVSSFEKSMEKRPKGLSKEEYWRQRIIANLLHRGAGPLAQKALAEGVSSSEIHYVLASHLFRSGHVEKAKSHAQKAFQIDPGSELAYLLLKEIAFLEGNTIDVDTSKLNAQELAEIEERWPRGLGGGLGRHRVLPWSDVRPIYEATRKLEWMIPQDVSTTDQFLLR